MKLEFLEAGSPDCPLIRLCDFHPQEAHQLKALFDCLADGSRREIRLDEKTWIEPIGRCKLLLRDGERDGGIAQTESSVFECVLTRITWSNVAGLVEPIFQSASSNAYQWLYDKGKISLLLSPSGAW